MTSGRVVYSCPFIPAEWVRAHGFTPSRIVPSISSASPNTGVCAYSHAFVNAVAREQDVSAVIVTTLCDQMRRSADEIAARISAPVFLMNVPHTWQTPGSHRLYREEVERLGRFLVSVGGEPASRDGLARVMSQFDEARARIRESRPLLSGRQYSELIASFHRDPAAESTSVGAKQWQTDPPNSMDPGAIASPLQLNTKSGRISRGVPVGIVGGPLMMESFEILDIIEQAGGYLALDGTETGERTLPAPFDRRRIADDPLGALCDAYFGGIPDPARRPNSEFFKWLGRMIEERGIRGLIAVHYLWCDTWRAEVRRIAEWSQLPLLPLDAGDGGLDQTRAKLRLEAFLEVVK